MCSEIEYAPSRNENEFAQPLSEMCGRAVNASGYNASRRLLLHHVARPTISDSDRFRTAPPNNKKLSRILFDGAMQAMSFQVRARVLLTRLSFCTLLLATHGAMAEPVDQLLKEAQTAAATRDSPQAIAKLTELVSQQPNQAEAYYLRGREYLRVGKFAESVADFDRYVTLRPQVASQMWERGIACYYAGQVAEGAAQFASYQSFDGNDVEDAVWHMLCCARIDGLEAARKGALRVRQDPRIPMTQVNLLFRGELSVAEVLSAAESQTPTAVAGTGARFYANLYVGLFYEMTGKASLAQQHLHAAVHEHRIDNFMWDVAKIHLERLDKTGIHDR